MGRLTCWFNNAGVGAAGDVLDGDGRVALDKWTNLARVIDINIVACTLGTYIALANFDAAQGGVSPDGIEYTFDLTCEEMPSALFRASGFGWFYVAASATGGEYQACCSSIFIGDGRPPSNPDGDDQTPGRDYDGVDGRVAAHRGTTSLLDEQGTCAR